MTRDNEPIVRAYGCEWCGAVTEYTDSLKSGQPILQALKAGWKRTKNGWKCPRCAGSAASPRVVAARADCNRGKSSTRLDAETVAQAREFAIACARAVLRGADKQAREFALTWAQAVLQAAHEQRREMFEHAVVRRSVGGQPRTGDIDHAC